MKKRNNAYIRVSDIPDDIMKLIEKTAKDNFSTKGKAIISLINKLCK